MTLQHLNPDTVSRPSAYTHVVTATGGTMVFIAGQVAKNAAGDLIGPATYASRPSKPSRT